MKWLIVGLGNPTDKYKNTRHNVGRDIVDLFQQKNSYPEWSFDKKKNARVSEGDQVLILPDTYMNDSGQAVRKFMKFLQGKEQAAKMIVVYDDLDLSLGKMKISFNKSSGGHKGVQSIIDHLKTQEFVRLRVGIAPIKNTGETEEVAKGGEVIDHVLSKFKPDEKEILDAVMQKSIKALDLILEKGYELASNEVNGW